MYFNQVTYHSTHIYYKYCHTATLYAPVQDGTELPLKEAHQGESIHSMLSILDAVIGHTRPFSRVAARASRDTYVLQ